MNSHCRAADKILSSEAAGPVQFWSAAAGQKSGEGSPEARPPGKFFSSRPTDIYSHPGQQGSRQGRQPAEPLDQARVAKKRKTLRYLPGVSGLGRVSLLVPTTHGPRAHEACVRQGLRVHACSRLLCHSLAFPQSSFPSPRLPLSARFLCPGRLPLNCMGESNGSLRGSCFSLFPFFSFFVYFFPLLTVMVSTF